MKLEMCKKCYYAGTEKCFFYNKKYEELKIENCDEGFIDPYDEEGEIYNI